MHNALFTQANVYKTYSVSSTFLLVGGYFLPVEWRDKCICLTMRQYGNENRQNSSTNRHTKHSTTATEPMVSLF